MKIIKLSDNFSTMEKPDITLTKEDIVYSKIGAALISAQRVEFVAGQLLELLEEHGQIYGIMTEDFTNSSEKSKKLRKKTLGQIFRFLKLNPKLVIADELDEYARLRNILAHKFFQTHLNTKSDEQMWRVMEFCYAFGRFSNRMEKFFKGFLYFLALRHISTPQFYRDLYAKNEDLKEDIEVLQERKEEVYDSMRDLYDRKDEAREKFLNMDEYARQKEKEIAEMKIRLKQLQKDYEPYKAQDDIAMLVNIFPKLSENLQMAQ